MSAPRKSYEQIAAEMAFDSAIAQMLGATQGSSVDFHAPSPAELRAKDEEAARVKAETEREAAERAQAQSKEAMLDARVAALTRQVQRTKVKLAKKQAKAARRAGA